MRTFPGGQVFTAKSFQVPGTPFRSCSPHSSKSIRDPTKKLFTVPETTISPAPAIGADSSCNVKREATEVIPPDLALAGV
jgi:hypothetical protein